ncbi:MAG TPA: hydantoinase B/oxoprolinase family protein [Hyphomicrobiaceae bacterium]|nr:hydantoinase B/oxoprolinase family protein [Hyphomicrobiaceae bacterium]
MAKAVREGKAALDPVTVEVIGNALASIAEEMGETLVRASYSTNIKERRDSSTCLFDAAGRTLCQAMHIPMHLGSLIGIVEAIYRRVPMAEIAEGDVFIGNDAYTGGGTHLPDLVLAEPIFFEGQLVGWATNTAHHADFVDRGHAHIFQEGIRIPPVRLYRRGELVTDVQEMILLNMQVPDERLNDLRAQMAANRLGVQRFQALCRRYGRDTLMSAAAALLDYAERLTRAGIRTIPSGTYRFEDVFDSEEVDGNLTFKVEIVVKDDEIALTFDAPRQVRAGFNLVETGLLATVYYALKTVIGPDIPPNAGFFRPITVTAPKGSVLNAAPPAAVNSRLDAGQRVVDLIHGALATAIPERVTAAHNGACVYADFSGVDPRNGRYYVYLETIGGGFGARATKDGLDGVHVHLTNTSNLPVEALETEYPLTIERYELVQDSGGPGRMRGGMALRRVVRAEHDECRTYIIGGRATVAPWGLDGGHRGGTAHFNFNAPSEAPDRGRACLAKGSSVEIVTPGAGGYGEPRLRDPAMLERDVADGKVSTSAARSAYGRA